MPTRDNETMHASDEQLLLLHKLLTWNCAHIANPIILCVTVVITLPLYHIWSPARILEIALHIHRPVTKDQLICRVVAQS
mmetsp:Transcript_113392/g.156701  ORF Transcript_113392/g.156701 Transcript_113392/m.156701 type:complete len:80 (+) Transcript_113392:78-317(+)